MQKVTCHACQAAYWIPNWSSTKDCPACGGSGIEAVVCKCSECGKALPASRSKYSAKTCGGPCTLAREARLSREKREKRGLKRLPYQRASEVEKSLKEPLTKKRRCHDCGTETWDYRCPSCRALWRAKHGAQGLNGLADLFTAGRCYAEVGA